MIKRILMIAMIIYGGYLIWEKHFKSEVQLPPLYEKPYIVMYGRESCGWTQKYIKDLRENKLEFVFKDVDQNAQELHSRMEISGLDISYYDLPVLDVNTKIMIRPDLKKIKTVFSDIAEKNGR